MTRSDKIRITIVVYLLFGVAGLLVTRWLFQGINFYSPMGLFAVYIFIIIIFGHIYYALYWFDRSHFSFASDVHTMRLGEVRHEAVDQEKNLVETIDILSQLIPLSLNGELRWTTLAALNEFFEINQLDKSLIDRARRSWAFIPHWAYAANLGLLYVVNVLGGQGAQICFLLGINGAVHKLVSKGYGIELCKITDDFKSSLQDAEKDLENVRRRRETLDSAAPDIWNIIDFLYFSTITQTTVGYGDMLPNSTSVRIWVMVQILLGLLVIGIIINMRIGGA